MTPSACSVEVSPVHTFDGLATEWERLWTQCPSATLFSRWDWQSLWWRHFGQGWALHLLTMRQAGRLVGLAPLMVRDGVALFIGGTAVADYLDFLVRPGCEEAFFTEVLAYARAQGWRGLDLHCLQPDSPTLRYLPELATRSDWPVQTMVEDVCPRLRLPRDFESYLAGLTKKDRHELRRKLRRLYGSGTVHWYAASDPLPAMDDFIRLHRQSTPEKAAFMTPLMERFFREMTALLAPEGLVRLYFLELDGLRVATAYCFELPGEVWLYNSGYDPAYGRLSVGLLLKAFCIQDAIARGKEVFDFLRGREPYKYDLGGVDRPLYRLVVGQLPPGEEENGACGWR